MLIEVTVEGVTALMLDAFTNELITKGPKTTNNGQDDDPEAQARSRLYTNGEGTPIFPADNLLSCIIDAGRFIKIGKRQLSTRDTTIVTTFLGICEPYMMIKGKWRVDSRGIVNQATKGRHVCHRPIFDDWGFSFTLDIDPKEVQNTTVRELIDRAGRMIGIGVMRPARKGRYGQFKVVHWKEDREKKGK